MQDTHECIYCVVDLHAITVWQDPKELRARHPRCDGGLSRLRPRSQARSIIFNQSQVAEHAELAWILSCVARMGWLNRMTQFKEKAGKDKEAASVGLFIYPILMAADILAYHATHVPVGEDQKQHLELARDIANKFNLDLPRDRAQRATRKAFSAARALHHRTRDARHVVARWHQENVEIGPLRSLPHQSYR